jgi:hypothetical protein
MPDLAEQKSKTRTLGHLSHDRAKKLNGWDNYEKHAKALAKARKDTEEAKEGIRTAISELPALRDAMKKFEAGTGDVDFTVMKDGKVNVFWVYKQEGKKSKSVDLG